MLHREASRGWKGWIAYVCERRRKFTVLTSTVGVFRHRALSKCLRHWVDQAVQRTRTDGPARRLFGRVVHRKLGLGFDKWRALCTHLNGLRRGTAAFRTPGLSRGWNAWTCALRESEQRMAFLRRAASAWRNRRLSAYMRSWTTSTLKQSASHGLFMRVVMRILNMAMNTWIDFNLQVWALRRGTSAFRLPGLRRAMRAWQERTHAQATMLQAMHVALARLRVGPRVCYALSKWASVAASAAARSVPRRACCDGGGTLAFLPAGKRGVHTARRPAPCRSQPRRSELRISTTRARGGNESLPRAGCGRNRCPTA